MRLPLYLLPSSFVIHEAHEEQQITSQKQEEKLR
jgi:hypothetical protein